MIFFFFLHFTVTSIAVIRTGSTMGAARFVLITLIELVIISAHDESIP